MDITAPVVGMFDAFFKILTAIPFALMQKLSVFGIDCFKLFLIMSFITIAFGSITSIGRSLLNYEPKRSSSVKSSKKKKG